MRKTLLILSAVFCFSMMSCEKTEIKDETGEYENLEIHKVDREDIERPGDQGEDESN